MSEISALPGSIVDWLSGQEALKAIRFTTEFPASKKQVPLTKKVVAVGIDSVKITDSFTENENGELVRDEYCRKTEIKIRLGIHAPFSQGGAACYDAFTDIIDTLTFASDLEITDSGCEGVTADRDTDAFVLTAYINVIAELCPAVSCSVMFQSFMSKELLCGTHINDSSIHLSAEQQEYLSQPVKSGFYFGTGSEERSFDLGFRPKAVIVQAHGAPPVVIDFANGEYSAYASFATDQREGAGLRITNNGFTAGNCTVADCDVRLNASATDYAYIAFR